MAHRGARLFLGLAAVAAGLAASPSWAQAGAWQAIAPLPGGRMYTSAAALDGNLYVGPFPSSPSLAVYSPASNAWTLRAALAARAETLVLPLGGKVYIVGGCAQSDCTQPSSLVEIYDPLLETLTAGPSLGTARFSMAGGALSEKLFVTAGGGVCPPCASQPANSEMLDPPTGLWGPRTPIPTPREYPASAVLDNKLYVIGGYRRTAGGAAATSVVEVFNPLSNGWTTAPALPIPVLGAAAATLDGRIHVTGGSDGANVFDTHFVFDPAANAWSSAAPMLSPRFGHGAAVLGGNLYVVGGAASAASVPLASAEVFKPVATTTFALSMQVLGAGSGKVTSSPAGISCPSACVASFAANTAVTLTAQPAAGSSFQGWGGACSGPAPCTITINASKNVTATFQLGGATATIAVSPQALAFGGQSLRTTSRPKAITIANTGPVAVTVGPVTPPAHFAAESNCGTLAPGATCTASITFTPLAEGALAGTLAIASTAGTVNVPLTGSGELSMVAHYYASILGREADASGKSFWESEATRLARLGINLNEAWYAMALSFFGSPEYVARGRDNAGYVGDLYRTFFNRGPDSDGLAFWMGQLAGGMPREVVLVGFLLSDEFVGFTRDVFGRTRTGAEVDLVVDMYRGLLGRLPDSAGFTFWLARFREAQCTGAEAVRAQADALSAQFLASPEYQARGRSDAQFVGDLYDAFLRRGGDLDGVRFWIGQAGVRARDGIRRDFTATPEFSARVQAVIAAGCQRMLEGSFPEQGARPARGLVTTVTRAGVQFVTPDAYVGWVQILVTPGTPLPDVVASVSGAGGQVVAAVPGAGLYVIAVAPGGERAALVSLYRAAFVIDGTAVTDLEFAVRVRAIDADSANANVCGARHGSFVSGLAGRRDPPPILDDVGPRPGAVGLVWALFSDMASVPPGEQQVTNLSWGYNKLAPTPGCDVACSESRVRHMQTMFFATLLSAMQAQWNVDPAVADRNLVTLSLGNAGLVIDASVIEGLKQRYPQGFERLVLVGGVDSASRRPPFLNDTTHPDALFARGVDVTVSAGGVTAQCTGTSFSAPEIASVLGRIWARNPTASSATILAALRANAPASRALPQDADGRTPNSFIETVQEAIQGRFTLTIVKAGSGNGTLTPSPLGPRHPPGTQVIVLAVPAAGSVFAGYSGACSGSSCVVVMDADKTVIGTFERIASDCAVTLSSFSVVVGAGAGSGTVSLNIPTGCPWEATSDAPWLQVTPSSGSQSTVLTYTFQANPTSADRVGHIVAGGQTLEVRQLASNPGNERSATCTATGSLDFSGVLTASNGGCQGNTYNFSTPLTATVNLYWNASAGSLVAQIVPNKGVWICQNLQPTGVSSTFNFQDIPTVFNAQGGVESGQGTSLPDAAGRTVSLSFTNPGGAFSATLTRQYQDPVVGANWSYTARFSCTLPGS